MICPTKTAVVSKLACSVAVREGRTGCLQHDSSELLGLPAEGTALRRREA